MIEPRLFVCSGAKAADVPGRRRIYLSAIGSKANVNICFENVAGVLKRDLSPRLIDLLEIASYVFSADCATSRGKQWADDYSTEPWSRDFAFVIPVRQPEFWKAKEITSQLTEMLNFLSNDKYSFTFVPLKQDRPEQHHLEFNESEKDWPFYEPDRVLMFSGGLDSLAGAVETATKGEKSVLVSHRPVVTLGARQQRLFAELRKKYPEQLIHIPVWINKNGRFAQEPTQRTRSFLYSALGTVVAESVKASGVRFFENGVVSLNLPVADEVLRSRASRTTHPITLQLMQSFYSAITERNFFVDNPYIHKTKTEVVEALATNNAAHLIAHTCSCAHLMFKPKSQWHCGSCSQCIDRRFAITAAGLVAHDSETDYMADVFLGPRKDGPEKSMAVDYVRHGIELAQGSAPELVALFNAEISRAVRYEPKRSEAAGKLIAMHKRHGEVVIRVLKAKVQEHAEELVQGGIDPTSLLAIVMGRKHLNAVDPLEASHSSQFVSSAEQHVAALGAIAEQLQSIVKRFESRSVGQSKKRKLSKRDTVIFAAILLGFKGMKYCQYLHAHGIKPKSTDSGFANYHDGYRVGEPWRKKIQDEKTRARSRMDQCTNPELLEAAVNHLRNEFDTITPLIHSRNSQPASKTSKPRKAHQH